MRSSGRPYALPQHPRWTGSGGPRHLHGEQSSDDDRHRNRESHSHSTTTSPPQHPIDTDNPAIGNDMSNLRNDFGQDTDITLSDISTNNNQRVGTGENPTFQPLRIYFETSELDTILTESKEYAEEYDDDDDTESFDLQVRVSTLMETVLPAAKRAWSSALSVIPTEDPIHILDDVCFGEVNVPEQYKKNGVADADVLIFVKRTYCEGNDVMAYAFPCALDQTNDRPLIGVIFFCLESLEVVEGEMDGKNLQKAIDIAIHELGHVFGINSSLLPYFRDGLTGEPLTKERTPRNVTCVKGDVRTDVVVPEENTIKGVVLEDGTRYFEVVTPKVKTVVRNQFDCHSMNGARLENHPTNEYDCFGSHWDERLFFTESMGAIFGELTNTLSPLTLALLEDSGWYKANYSASEISTFGHRAGCDFVDKPCIVDGEVPPYADGFFCNRQLQYNKRGQPIIQASCDMTNNHVAICDLVDRNLLGLDRVPERFQYFENPNLGPIHPYQQADFCPMPSIDVYDCHNETRKPNVMGERFGEDSRCYNFEMAAANRIEFGAHCLKTICDEENKNFKIRAAGAEITCEYDGQIHDYPGYNKKYYPDYSSMVFKCPRFAVICPDLICPKNCSGRGKCETSDNISKCVCFDENDDSADCSKSLEPDPTLYFKFTEKGQEETSVPMIMQSSPPTSSIKTFSLVFHALPDDLDQSKEGRSFVPPNRRLTTKLERVLFPSSQESYIAPIVCFLGLCVFAIFRPNRIRNLRRYFYD